MDKKLYMCGWCYIGRRYDLIRTIVWCVTRARPLMCSCAWVLDARGRKNGTVLYGYRHMQMRQSHCVSCGCVSVRALGVLYRVVHITTD